MIWSGKEIALYFQEKKYIDTVTVPLLPVSFGDASRQEAEQGEFIPLLTSLLERQFKGRMLLLPPFTYFSTESDEQKNQRLHNWIDQFKKEEFKNIIFVTADSYWRAHEQDFDADIIWMPSIPMEHMDAKYKQNIVEDQVSQLVKIIVRKWQAN
ncbi:YpiF family protein [Jeotgalibacillus aurantiacus]|uniref:YpiF family protein n=1 Tax=Jeotgalibacillus aurantiacus TaxID=2763266 RepID=UPI001D0A52C9|nr:YpiF family protein [Jeotgalibacillus aurantiacus]